MLVTVAGEVDIATVPRLREQLFALAAGGRPLIADLDRVSFIDAAGSGCWPARPGGPPRTGAACTWSAPGPDPAAVPPDRAGPPVGLAGTVGEALQRLAAGPDTRARAAQDSQPDGLRGRACAEPGAHRP